MNRRKRIVVIGPESTGKSTLCERLASHYQTIWVPEYAREYLLTHGNSYGYGDLLTIARGQIALEENMVSGQWSVASPVNKGEDLTKSNSPLTTHHSLIFIDTDMYVMKVWCEFVYGRCHQWILDQIVSRQYDLYLLCNTDLPWVKDELREYPDPGTRERLFHIYKDILVNQHVRWAVISGNDEERLQMAFNAVETMEAMEEGGVNNCK